MTDQTWNALFDEQLSWHWAHQLRPRLAGLTDAEYFREPVADCWSVRPRGTGTAPIQGGSGAMTADFAFPTPDPEPFTTIAWRLAHVIVGCLAIPSATHFGRTATDYLTFDYAPTATAALDQLDTEYAGWQRGVRSLTDDDLLLPSGDPDGPFADRPLGTVILNVNRELIHHLAEVCLLRDLYLRTEEN